MKTESIKTYKKYGITPTIGEKAYFVFSRRPIEYVECEILDYKNGKYYVEYTIPDDYKSHFEMKKMLNHAWYSSNELYPVKTRLLKNGLIAK